MDVLPKTAACTHSLHHGNRTERVGNSPRFLRHGGKDNESHHHRFGRHHDHGYGRGEIIEIPAGHILTVVKTAPESTESTGVQSSDFARIVRIGRHGSHGGRGRYGISETDDSHGSSGRHGCRGGFRGGHRRGEMSAGLVASGETADKRENMTAGEISERGAGGWKSRGKRHGSHGNHWGRGMRHVSNDASAPVDEPKSEGGDGIVKDV